jgi:SAM-dependent methyltransferase
MPAIRRAKETDRTSMGNDSLVSEYPRGFVPDLRRPGAWPSLRHSLWRNPDLVRLTFGELARMVLTRVGRQPCRILYVGSGLGHTALELARAGHDVTGVDIDEESVALAKRAAKADPFRDERGALSYEVAAFPDEVGTGDRTIASCSPGSCTISRTP